MLQFKRLFVLISFIALCNIYAFAQLEGNNLCFGFNTTLDFNCGKPLVRNDITLKQSCTSSISDSNGNLLFYFNRKSIFNKNQQLISGGRNPMYMRQSENKDLIIVPQPGNESKYNVIYLNTYPPNFNTQYLCRIQIDMSLNSGLGKIINQDSFRVKNSISCLQAAKHKNNRDYWILAIDVKDSLFSFLLNSISFSHVPVVSSKPLILSPNRWHQLSVQTISYDQKHIAFYYYMDLPSAISIVDFDNSTGKLTGMKYFLTILSTGKYRRWTCFSPNGKYLYVTNDGNASIFQYDISLLTTSDIQASVVNIGNSSLPYGDGQMILAPDNKIYMSKTSSYFEVINYPDKKGLACNYKDSSLYTGSGILSYTIPNFITRKPYVSRFNYSGTCTYLPTDFSLAIDKDSTLFKWDFGDPGSGALNCSYLDEPSHIYRNPGRYKVRLVTNRNTVKDTSARYVCIDKMPIHLLSSDTIFCSSDSITLNAQNNGFDYLWSTGDTTQIITVKDTGIYILTVKNNNCFISDTITVFSGSTFKSIFGYRDTFICSGATIRIDTKLKGYKFTWSTGDTTSFIIISDSGKYVVKVQNGNCIMTDSVLIGIKNKPLINLGNDTAICSGENILLDAKYKNGTYKWSTGETSRSILIHNKGIYSVIVNKDTCAAYDSIHININPLPYLNLGNDTALCEDDTQTILLDAGNATYYQWLPGNENTSKIIVTKTGTYTVIIIDSNGCISSDSINIEDNCKNPIFIPNAFSPNNDGINDFFLVSGTHFISLEMIIFDRWGEQIFKTNVPEKGWDGTFKNLLCPQGVYLYIISIHTKEIKKIFSGSVTLLR